MKNLTEYNLLVSHRHYKLIKIGNKKATATSKEGNELQQYIGWLILSRTCKISVYDENVKLTRIISST